jgi:pimeloyl-ACP methyl ester carboxylesterase
VIAEATHFYRRKPRSQAFFESMIGERRALGDSVTAALARDHGAGWPQVLERHSSAWQSIAREAVSDEDDFYGGRLGEIAVPVLVIHGARDPRTEPGEIEALGRVAQTVILPAGGHSPHSEPATADDVSRIARAFIDPPDLLDPLDPLDPPDL